MISSTYASFKHTPGLTIKLSCSAIELFLIGPKIIASLFIFPIVIMYSIFFGFLGGGLVCYFTEIIPVNQYILGIRAFSEDNFVFIRYALTKTIVFAFLITSISSYFGYYLRGGALEVGKASTNAVVYSSIFAFCKKIPQRYVSRKTQNLFF